MSDTANMRQDYRSPKEGIDLTKSGQWPDQSAKHADAATMALIRAGQEQDSLQRDYEVRQAQIYATLSLRDKVDELVATLGHTGGQIIESNERLNENVKTAAQHLHDDAQSLQRHLQVVRDGNAA